MDAYTARTGGAGKKNWDLLQAEGDLFTDQGRFALAQGYDGLIIDVGSSEEYVVLLNRSIVTVQREGMARS
jgi:hypothetical protein